MKKILALVLCLVLAFALTGALAEGDVVETLFDGAWVQFQDGFELYLPADWMVFECTEEMNANGIFFMAGSEDQSYTCAIAWDALDAELTIEQVQEKFAEVYSGAEIMVVNDVALVVFADADNNTLNFVALDGTEPGYYLFTFYPMDDEDYQTVAALIASSIRNM